MAFSDYKTLDQVQRQFDIAYQEELYLDAEPTEPSPQFLTEMEFNRENIDVFAMGVRKTNRRHIDKKQ